MSHKLRTKYNLLEVPIFSPVACVDKGLTLGTWVRAIVESPFAGPREPSSRCCVSKWRFCRGTLTIFLSLDFCRLNYPFRIKWLEEDENILQLSLLNWSQKSIITCLLIESRELNVPPPSDLGPPNWWLFPPLAPKCSTLLANTSSLGERLDSSLFTPVSEWIECKKLIMVIDSQIIFENSTTKRPLSSSFDLDNSCSRNTCRWRRSRHSHVAASTAVNLSKRKLSLRECSKQIWAIKSHLTMNGQASIVATNRSRFTTSQRRIVMGRSRRAI